jgi:glycosyltransferase involved in cell wall biosynthesis
MSKSPIICVVAAAAAPDPEASGDGSPRRTAAALVRAGWEVHLLVCASEDGDGSEAGTFDPPDVVVHRLDELPRSPGADAQRYGGDDPILVIGEHALEALEGLHAEHRFDLIEFAEAGVAMRSVQSRRSGDALVDVPLAVRLHAPAFQRRAAQRQTLDAPRGLKVDFGERYAFEHADHQLATSADLLATVARRGWVVRPGARVMPSGKGSEADERLAELYREMVGPPRDPGPAPTATATVTVVVAHYNHELYLEATLSSLARQTRAPDEVIVIDDGSTSAAALDVFAAAEARYPHWRFVRQENVGPGATRNRGLELATGSLFLPFDSDNIATETMIGRLARAMERNPDRAATTCHNLAFTRDEEIDAGRFAARYSPTGGPPALAAVENVFGDTCSIFRTAVLRSVGGFEINRWSPTEDWETFVKMAVRGLEIDVLPRPLFYYRTDAGGRLQHLGTDRATKLRLRAHLLDEFFAAAPLEESERRQLFEALQAFDDLALEGVEERLAEQRRWHDAQMADLDAYRERQVQELHRFGDERVAEQEARVETEATRAETERARAETAEHELAALRQATSGSLVGRAVRWRAK